MEPKDILYENAKALFNNAPFGYFSCNTDHTFISANYCFLQWVGHNNSSLFGNKKLTDFLTEEAQNNYTGVFLTALFSNGFVKDYTLTLCLENADTLTLLLNSDICKNENGGIILIRTTATQITQEDADNKKIEAALLEANLQLELAQKVAKTGHWTFDPQTEKYNFSNECYRIFEFDNDFDGSYAMFMGIIHPDDLGKLVETRERIIAGETAFQIDHRILLKDGSVRWINTQSVVDKNEGTGELFLRGTSQDITERKNVEEVVRNSEEKYRLIVETAQEGIWMIDKHDNTTFVNSAMANMLGYTVDEMLGKDLFYFMDENGKRLALDNIEKRKNGITEQHEFCFITKDNSPLWALIETGPMYKNGIYDGALAMVMNINNRKRINEQIKKLNEELEIKVKERTKALLDANNLLQEAQKLSKMGSWDFDLLTGKVNWSAELYDIYEIDKEKGAVPYNEQISLYYPEDWQKLDTAVNRAITFGESYQMDLKIYKKNGVPGYVFAKGEATKDKEGKVIRLAGIAIDISQRKITEEQLKINSMAFETALEGIVIADAIEPDYPNIYANKAFYTLTGYEPNEIIGKSCRLLQGVATNKQTTNAIKKCLLQQQAFEGEILNYKKDGSTFWNLLRLTPVFDDKGKVSHIVGFQYDITSRKKNEDALQLITERFTMAKKSAQIGVWDWDVVNDILIWDEEMYSIYNITPDKFAGAYAAYEAGLHPDDKDEIKRKVQEAMESGNTLDIEFRIIWPDNSIHFIKGNAIVQKNILGEPVRMIGINLDVSNQKNLELRLEKSRKELEAFSYSVSHDLRAPLRGIDGWSLALLEDYGNMLDDTGVTYLNRVRSETQRMGVLIDQMLKLSQISRMPLKIEMVNLSALAKMIIDRIKETTKQLPIVAYIQEQLFTIGDRNLLEIMLTNLFNNAVKFSGKNDECIIYFGKIVLEGKSTFYIKDNGVGFSMENSKKLFGAFQRMHKQSDFEGYGIGLATVQRIISMHEGKIWAEAELNKGATFFFSLND